MWGSLTVSLLFIPFLVSLAVSFLKNFLTSVKIVVSAKSEGSNPNKCINLRKNVMKFGNDFFDNLRHLPLLQSIRYLQHDFSHQ